MLVSVDLYIHNHTYTFPYSYISDAYKEIKWFYTIIHHQQAYTYIIALSRAYIASSKKKGPYFFGHLLSASNNEA